MASARQGTIRPRASRSRHPAITAVGAALATIVFVPQALAFPHHRQVGDTAIYSVIPLSPNIDAVLGRSDTLLRKSAIYGPGYGKRIFLTGGGWRWRVLALQSPGAFAFTRPLTNAIVVNDTDIARDTVTNGRGMAGTRSLSGVIAHERTHGLINRHFGLLSNLRYPAWLREGYCDVIAGGGSLSDRDAEMLKRTQRSVSALAYYDGRRRVAAALSANGGSVDKLFAAARWRSAR